MFNLNYFKSWSILQKSIIICLIIVMTGTQAQAAAFSQTQAQSGLSQIASTNTVTITFTTSATTSGITINEADTISSRTILSPPRSCSSYDLALAMTLL